MRSFIAIEFPVIVRQEIGQLCELFRKAPAQDQLQRTVRWVNPENIHLTLRFLGNTSADQCRELADKLRPIARAYRPVHLAVGAPGCFPNCRRPRVIWLGLAGDLVLLRALQSDIEMAIQQVGFEAETRAFAPHVTVGRVQRHLDQAKLSVLASAVAEFVAEFGQTDVGSQGRSPFVARELVHMRSQLQPSGPIYTPIGHFPLGNG